MTETLFKVGSVYRDGKGTPNQVIAARDNTDFVIVRTVGGGVDFTHHKETGAFWFGGVEMQSDSYKLLPGELHQINGEWVPRGVPVEDKPAIYERERVSERKTIVKRVPRPGVNYGPPTTERTRPALDWADSKRVDRWEGYVVYSDAVSSGFVPSATPAATHPLQRIAQEGDQLHGSAFLRKG
jgi:hypothetical protein